MTTRRENLSPSRREANVVMPVTNQRPTEQVTRLLTPNRRVGLLRRKTHLRPRCVSTRKRTSTSPPKIFCMTQSSLNTCPLFLLASMESTGLEMAARMNGIGAEESSQGLRTGLKQSQSPKCQQVFKFQEELSLCT